MNTSDANLPEVVRGLVDRPHESLSVEVKSWFDPNTPEGRAKIAKACLALRNQNGGYIVVGFDDVTLVPVTRIAPPNVRDVFHGDVVQRIVSGYSSHLFEVIVHFVTRDETLFPVIQIPSGVTTPAACKADLRSEEKYLLRESEIYVRTLASNGTVSSARASWKDLESLMSRCHDNREADLARVFARMAQGMTRESFAGVLRTFSEFAEVASSVTVTPTKLLAEGEKRFEAVAQQRKITLPPHGCWDTALVLQGQIPPHRPNRDFFQLLASANPDLTGWPVWLDSSPFADQTARPYVAENRWEAFMFEAPSERASARGERGHLDFWTLDPKGLFFLRRAHQDDLGGSNSNSPMTVLDPLLVILRVGEALAVGQAFARAIGCDEKQTKLSFAFQWTNLQGRHLDAWANPRYRIVGHGPAHQNVARSVVTMPQSANEETICLTTHDAVLPVMAVFGGYEPKYELTRGIVAKLLQRKL